MVDEAGFRYVAVSSQGRRVRGVVTARDEARAFERLRQQGLAPLSIRRERGDPRKVKGAPLKDREVAEIVGNLADLLKAGADMRTALAILGARSTRPATAALCRNLAGEIGGGEALDAAFTRNVGKRGALVGALVAAGEAAGDLSGGLSRAADLIQAKLKLQEKLVSILAYPAFVLVSTVAAVIILLLFVIPTLAPLTADMGAEPPLALSIMIALSNALRENLALIGAGLGLLAAAGLLAARAGVLQAVIDRLLLEGPARRTTTSLVFGGFSIAIGGMLTAGAPMSETLRLAIRAVGSPLARKRLEPVLHQVRQGESLSASLERVRGFPGAISRLAAVGEATGALGPMLTRAGRLEEEAAIRRIEQVGQILGPALIVGLGGLVGMIMASLLSGVSQLGGSALG
ncbi:type II secretion system F family protein [Caulobacter sp. SSI4214]|uniref:type II secretion system F family protein n=1 Tax=Caulobacter sp. SSI4214 TaxID=2575739 RepID=UPI0014388A5A|nr:type II secretion system F family protein [Caulobacter sp. SSI4214]